MKSERTGEWIVNKYWDSLMDNTGDDPSLKQQLLHELLSDNDTRLPVWSDNPTEFHRAFRTVDICGTGGDDMLVWTLMADDKIIWKVLEEFYE